MIFSKHVCKIISKLVIRNCNDVNIKIEYKTNYYTIVSRLNKKKSKNILKSKKFYYRKIRCNYNFFDRRKFEF